MATMLTERLKREPRRPTLRMSSMGKPNRQLWYEINRPELAEKMHPNAYLKFLVGDILEEVVLILAELSGHRVEGQQDEMNFVGIRGHRDAVVDGMTVDVKSASPYAFKKFEDHLTSDKDAFGYLTQISSYVHAAKEDPLVLNKDEGAFIAVQKVTGDIVVDIQRKTPDGLLDIVYEHKKEMVTKPEPPDRCFEPEAMGKSGNMKLGVNCSYCPFKWNCWDGLRAFHYSTSPVFLTEIKNEPRVPEFDRNGKIIETTIPD